MGPRERAYYAESNRRGRTASTASVESEGKFVVAPLSVVPAPSGGLDG